MKIKTTTYKQKFPTFQFLNCDIGFETSVGENENPLDALKRLKTLAEEFHKQEFPHLYSGTTIEQVPDIPVFPQPKKDSKEEALQRTIDAISQCSEIKVLETFWKLVKSNPQLVDAYNKKLNTLK